VGPGAGLDDVEKRKFLTPQELELPTHWYIQLTFMFLGIMVDGK
jgi:hypothetical protein